MLAYYSGLQQGGRWEEFLSDTVQFTSFVTTIKRVAGRVIFLESTRRFYSMIQSVDVEKLVVEDHSACALTRYSLQPPSGPVFECHVAEAFEVRDGKISVLATYFDSAPFPQ